MPSPATPSPSLPLVRPQRLRIQDELGRLRTLDCAAFLTLTGGSLPECPDAREHPLPVEAQALLLFGLGPEPASLAAFIAAWRARTSRADGPVYWIECPDFERHMPKDWKEHIPAHWMRLHLPCLADHDSAHNPAAMQAGLQRLLARVRSTPPAHIWRYGPGMQLFSSFWGPLLGAAQAELLGGAPVQKTSRTVLLPGNTGDLLTFELEQAVAQAGFVPVRPELFQDEQALRTKNEHTENAQNASNTVNLRQLLRHERPALFLSVNLRGLDADGETFRLLQACGVPVALWFVDNPWHILSSLRVPWWREAALFVTDASFLAPLRQHGAAFVRHLPLGTWMQPPSPSPSPVAAISQQAQASGTVPPLQPLVFVGRSSFPARDRFFAGCRLPEPLLLEGMARLHTSAPPHAHWWEQRLGIETCWPGNAIRQAGYAAEHCTAQRRRDWLQAAAPLGLTVFGDEAWAAVLPPCDIRPPLDYYGTLPAVYAKARYSLNVTSLLLPEGLTQRHFDVWAAGGFLFSDASPGLSLFPRELVEPMTVTSPHELTSRINSMERDSLLRRHLIEGWKACLSREHSYLIRFKTLLQELSLETTCRYVVRP